MLAMRACLQLWTFFITLPYFKAADSKSTLLDAVIKAAGVYVDASNTSPQASKNLSNVVIVTSVNFGYLNHLHNFKCFIDRLNLKVLVVAMDLKVHNYISDHMVNFYSYYATGNDTVHEEATVFRTKQFHVITNRKKEIVLSILKLDFDVFFLDPDVILLRDPFNYLIWDNVDYVHSVNQVCPNCLKWDFYKTEEEGNTGVYFLRSNSKTIGLLSKFQGIYPKHPDLDDQTIFWAMLRAMKPPVVTPLVECSHQVQPSTSLVTCHLDGCLFSAGNLRGAAYTWLESNLKQRNLTAVSIHANFLKGNHEKMKSLMRRGLWTATQTHDGKYTYMCRQFEPPF